MFERFTIGARRVLFHAREAASRLGSSAIEPEHLLLGVLEDDTERGARIVARICGDLEDPRSAIVRHATSLPKTIPDSQEIPFSAPAKRVLQYAAEEADRLSHDHIGTEHLLLGVMREERSLAADVLVARGLRIEAVREAIVALLSGGEQPEPPGPPPTPANTYRWPSMPFVPSRTVHILHSGMQPPQQPVINHPGPVFSAYGYTLEEIIVTAWEGNRWHIEIPPALRDNARFDFLMVLPRPEPTAVCFGLLRSAIEQQFAVHVTRETRSREVYVLTKTDPRGQMLRRYPDPPAGTAFSMLSFSTFLRRPKDAPMFPLDGFAVHSVPFVLLVRWFEEILGGQIIDDARLPGIYGFELKPRVNTPEALIQLLRDEAGLLITRERRELPTLIVRTTEAQSGHEH